MSEKLDGIRCYWDGRFFYTRNDNRIDAPQWVIDQMPTNVKLDSLLRSAQQTTVNKSGALVLDGELYCGRQKFDICMGIKSNAGHDAWKEAKYHVFDILGVNEPFEKRVEMIVDVAKEVEFIVDVKHKKCRGREHLIRKMNCIVKLGGEGIMLRKPKTKYEGKRSKTLLKCKPEYDAEAKVIGYVDGKDSLEMEMESGITFRLSTKFKSKDDFPIGTIITYKFNELFKSGKPRFAVMMRVREEATEAKDFVF